MSLSARVGRRLALTFFALLLVFTLAFGFVALTPDPNVNKVRMGAAMSCQGPPDVRTECIEEEIAAYRQANDLDEPVHERYARWLVAMVSLDWGVSTSSGAPVVGSIAARLPYTLGYVLPSMLLSAAGGVAVGAWLALRSSRSIDRLGTAFAYLGYAVPNFWLAALLLWFAYDPHTVAGRTFTWDPYVSFGDPVLDAGTLARLALPTAVLSTTLFASQLRYTRAETLEHLGSELVLRLRAFGVGDGGVARHLLRLSAPLLASLFVVDLFGVLVVNVFVLEYVFELPGFGHLAYGAIVGRDVPLLLGTTMVIAVVGVLGHTLMDLATLLLDPRTRESGE